MKIIINIGEMYKETEIIVNSGQMSDELEKVIAMIHVLDSKLTGMKDGQTYILDAARILYIDTADKKTFLYTDKDVYETVLRLYELEQRLPSDMFFRAGKSVIINFGKIKSLKSDIDGRITVTMDNNEKLIVSRQYASYIKEKLRRYSK